MNGILRYCESQRPWAIDRICSLARLESPTTDKQAVDRCGRAVETELVALGGRVTRLCCPDAGDHLVAQFGDADRPVMLLGHFDTVWPVGQLERMPIVTDNERLLGPGVFDMKAGIVLALLAVRALVHTGRSLPPLVFFLSSDEETGSRTSRTAIEEHARKSRAVLVLEPPLPGGALKTARKGCGRFDLTVTGIAAHAGIEPEKGANAIAELAAQLLFLEQLEDRLQGVSITVCTVSGGTRANVVPDHAVASIDVRVPTLAAAAQVDAAFRGLRPLRAGTHLSVSGGFDRPPLERTAAVLRLYEEARLVAAALGHELSEGATGGGSDGNFTAALGVPTLDGLGAIGDGAHAGHEHVEIGALAWRAALLAGLIERTAGR